MKIRVATHKDFENISQHDAHISREQLKLGIDLSRVYVIEEKSDLVGWLRFNLFWDNTPFLNMLYVMKNYRGKGYGRALLSHWENEMHKADYPCVLTPTLSTETARYFYEKHGYENISGFNYLNEPYEIIYQKRLK